MPENMEIQPFCKEQFEKFEKQGDIRWAKVNECLTEIKVLKNDMSHLTKSLNSLSKALWGVAGSLVATLLGFFIWYVQNLK